MVSSDNVHLLRTATGAQDKTRWGGNAAFVKEVMVNMPTEVRWRLGLGLETGCASIGTNSELGSRKPNLTQRTLNAPTFAKPSPQMILGNQRGTWCASPTKKVVWSIFPTNPAWKMAVLALLHLACNQTVS